MSLVQSAGMCGNSGFTQVGNHIFKYEKLEQKTLNQFIGSSTCRVMLATLKFDTINNVMCPSITLELIDPMTSFQICEEFSMIFSTMKIYIL
jgi:hypothetical protein